MPTMSSEGMLPIAMHLICLQVAEGLDSIAIDLEVRRERQERSGMPHTIARCCMRNGCSMLRIAFCSIQTDASSFESRNTHY